MTRITLWALSTLSVLVLLFGYHTSTAGPSGTASPPAAYSGSVAGAPAAATSGGTTAGTFTGDAADTRWGPVQVAITVADGTITDVQVPEYPTGNPKDEEINQYALPVLIQSTLDAQGGDIDMVSGATVTSVGYQESLQSALDQAGL
ncbi:FMN-binding protein [Nocardioides sp.]|uniref:FMN-binding protein n=1 Tax=Nocardioides sp. TaxID=35761 RepID=UPI00271F02DF|nr:FMN-binding protein [Nocardioides sp.]MDO9454533.1 FMN-binding protein [Nocardioides sp.]